MPNPDELKQKVMDYCTQDSIPFKESPIKSDDPIFYWSLSIGNIIVYCQKKYPDRIYYQQQINLAPEQIEMVSKWDNMKKSNLFANLTRNAIEFDYNHEFLFNEQNIVGVRIHKLTVGDTSKSDFITTLIRVQNIMNYTFNLLSSTMGIEMNLQKQQTQTSSQNPLSG
ncbi:MAG: hypothetical protein K8Q89_09405 [Nitrosarchaeum sp.]|nr:hypothetical protein [Nitrosarchaeum sp.]